MQFAILIYHYTGASRILWIYKIIRLLVASYLFMTGFGHTVFFYRKQDYSLRRCASVLVRLNLLSCLLPYVMGTDYLFYYFAPLVSFWYLVVYITMRIGHTSNTSMPFLLGKIGISVALVTGFVKSPKLFESIFRLLQYTCRIKWNVKEWRFRLALDLYIVYAGMLAAILYSRVSDILHTQRFPQHDQISVIRRHWITIRILSVIVALMVLPAFWSFAHRFPDKFEYNLWVPYISPIPIACYIILRNCNQFFRNTYSSIFAWLGRCSLETFTLQFHIWLAADTKGLLSLGVFGRKITHTEGRHFDLAVLTMIFLWLSWLTADATATVTNWIIDPDQSEFLIDTQSIPLPIIKVVESRPLLDGLSKRKHHAGVLSRSAKSMKALWMEKLEVRLFAMMLSLWTLNIMWP